MGRDSDWGTGIARRRDAMRHGGGVGRGDVSVCGWGICRWRWGVWGRRVQRWGRDIGYNWKTRVGVCGGLEENWNTGLGGGMMDGYE